MTINVDKGAAPAATIGAKGAGAVVALVLCFFAGMFMSPPARAGSADATVLASVNGQPITGADIDRLIMAEHRYGAMSEENSGIVERLLNKRINDLLIIQDALAAGMDEEPEIVDYAKERREKYAIEAFVKDNLELPDSPPADSVRAFFERYYWQIQLRRISVRTREEAEELRSRVIDGADMEALARELSLDTRKPTGGLYNLLYWADVENRIRVHVRYLDEGEVSAVFPYNDAFTFVRVERRLGVDESSFERFRPGIEARVQASYNQELWEQFVADLGASMKMQESMAAMMGILADSSAALTGEFRDDDPTPAIWIEGGPTATTGELREAVSHEVMQNAEAPFAENFSAGRDKVKSRLVLAHAARRAGYFEDKTVEERVARDVEQKLIELYLADTVASRIKFNRAELDQFYEDNKERFRGPEQVKLDILILDSETDAREASRRLAEGADFAFIFKEYRPDQEVTLGQSRYIAATQLSKPYRDQLEHMKVGQSSEPMEMSMGWVIFKLAGRRPGEVAPIEAVEMNIRRAVYQQKFNEYLDEHLGLLKEQSEIVEYPDRIEAYILSGEEG